MTLVPNFASYSLFMLSTRGAGIKCRDCSQIDPEMTEHTRGRTNLCHKRNYFGFIIFI